MRVVTVEEVRKWWNNTSMKPDIEETKVKSAGKYVLRKIELEFKVLSYCASTSCAKNVCT